MSIASLQCSFKVSQVPYTLKTDTLLNIKKRREQILFTAHTDRENINLAYLQTKPVDTANNLFISDHSGVLIANRVISTDPISVTGSSFNADIDTFLLTDIFTPATATASAKPIFSQHLISRDRFNPDDTNQTITSFEILDTDLQTIENPKEVLQATTSIKDINYGVIYNNFENTFDENNDLPIVYYIKYTVRTSTKINSYVELLDNSPIYKEADFDDIDSSGVLLSGRKTYLIEDVVGGGFLVTISHSGSYSYIETINSKIKIIKPTLRDTNTPWFISVSNGKFFTKLANSSDSKKYEIAEFTSQIFTPYFPYKTETRLSPVSFGSNLFKLPHNNIVIDPDQLFDLVVEIVELDGTTSAVYSSTESKIGTPFSSELNFADGIRSVDQLGGFLDLRSLPTQDQKVLVSYVRSEINFELTDINFNPANNNEAIKEFVAVYVLPETTAAPRTLFYLRVDKSGKIIYSSEAAFLDAVGSDIAARMSLPGGLYYDIESPTGEVSFIDRYTIESSYTSSGVIFSNNPNLLVLGEVYVGNNFAPEQVGIVDLRVRGGGLKETVQRTELLSSNPESLWNWDIGFWDGTPYPGSSSYLVEIPCDVLTTHSSLFTKDEVRSIVSEHTALGVYPVIHYYGVDPICSGVNITSSGLTLNWNYMGPNISYNVYKASSEVGPYSKLNTYPLLSTSFTVSGLLSHTNYWFSVTGIDENHECSDSSNKFILGVQTR